MKNIDTYVDDRSKDTKILPHQERPKPEVVKTTVDEESKGITTDSLSSGFIKGNVNESVMDALINTKIKISNSVAANIGKALHDEEILYVKQMPNTVKKLVAISGIGEKSAQLILKLKKEKR